MRAWRKRGYTLERAYKGGNLEGAQRVGRSDNAAYAWLGYVDPLGRKDGSQSYSACTYTWHRWGGSQLCAGQRTARNTDTTLLFATSIGHLYWDTFAPPCAPIPFINFFFYIFIIFIFHLSLFRVSLALLVELYIATHTLLGVLRKKKKTKKTPSLLLVFTCELLHLLVFSCKCEEMKLMPLINKLLHVLYWNCACPASEPFIRASVTIYICTVIEQEEKKFASPLQKVNVYRE